MYSLKALLFTVFGLYLLAFGVILIQSLNSPITPTLYNKEPSKKSKGTSFLTLPSSDSPYRFSDPALAYKILTQLDGYKTPFRAEVYKPDKKDAYLGLKKDSSYCDRHRDYFVHHPESVFEQKNIITSWDTDSYFELILREMPNATDVHRNNMKSTTKELMKNHMFEMPINTNNYFSPYSFYNYYTMQEEFSCLSQTSSQIPGHTTITMKDEVCQAATEYVEMFKDRPHCISHDKYFPKGYVLSDKNQCKAFFNILKTKAHKDLLNERKIVYIKKNPRSHRGAGVMPLDKLQENKLIKEYKNGLSCGKIKKEIVVQHYVHNPLLLNGRKFDFRMYMLVASVNPLIAYYHDGLLRISLLPYDSKSTDKKVLLTNLILSEQIHQDAREGKKFEGMDEEDLRNAQQWNFTQLESYLLETGLTKDKNWLNNYLKPEFKKALIHLARMSSDNYVKHSSFYGLYGIDFMLDTDLKLWFIEVNAGPAFGGYSKPMDKIISKMLRDHFDVVFGLLRSRMKRVVSFVNKLIEDESVYVLKNGDVIIKDLDRTRRTFDEITKNYFEKEFELSPDNGFELIIDENLSGVDVYQGYVPQSCL